MVKHFDIKVVAPMFYLELCEDPSARPQAGTNIKIGSKTSLSGSGSQDRTEAKRHGANVRPRDQLFEILRSWESGSSR